MLKAPRFERRAAFRVVGMQIRAQPFSDEFGKLWQDFSPRMGKISGRIQPQESYGVEWDMDTATSLFSYLAGVAVEAEAPIPEGMRDIQVPAQEYVVFDFQLKDVQTAMKQIYEEWLPTSGYQHSRGPEFELYDQRFNPDAGQFEMSYYLPVLKKSA